MRSTARSTKRYLAALGIPVVAGRNFAAHEAEPVVIVDENVADKYWPGGNALGQRLRTRRRRPDRLVHGHRRRARREARRASRRRRSRRRSTGTTSNDRRPAVAFALRTVVPPSQLAGAVDAAIAALDPEVALYDTQTMDERVSSSLGPQRTPMVLTLVFAGVAFALAVIGIYGVLAWAVAQRIGEIGVRMALGARAADIGRMILRQGGRLIAIGLVVGVVGALALGRVLSSQIDRVGAFDPGVLASPSSGLGGAALVRELAAGAACGAYRSARSIA